MVNNYSGVGRGPWGGGGGEDKDSCKLGIKENFFNRIKTTYQNKEVNIIFNEETSEAFSLQSGTRWGHLPPMEVWYWKS